MNHALRISLVAFLLVGAGALLSPRRIWREVARRSVALGNWLSAETPPSRVTVLIVTWIVALVPMLHLTYLVRHYAVEVPTLDDWEMAPLIEQAHTGRFPWSQIFAQQQEARTVLPKLIFILSTTVRGHWDVRDLMALSIVCCWLTAAGIFILLRRTGLRPIALALCFWLAVLTIFTPAQFEIWIFAFGFPSFCPALFLVTALVVIGSERFGTTTKFVVCALLSAASTFTLANGLLAWGITFPVLLLSRPMTRRRLWLGAWLMTTTLCAAAYFWGYRKPPELPTFAPAVSWMDYVRFALEFLGGGLTYAWKNHAASAAALFGCLQLALFLMALIYCLRRIRDRAFLLRAWPWFALAAHSIGSAILAALGRVGYGAAYALASRYVTFSIYLTIAVIALVALVVQELTKARPTLRTRAWTSAISLLLVLVYLASYKVMAFNTRFFLRAQSARDRLARVAVVFSQTIDTSETIKKTAYPNDARRVIEAADGLDRLKLLRPPLVRANQIEALPHEAADGRRASGSCESITPIAGNLVRATGWALLNGKARPADGVVVAYQVAPDKPWTLCAISDAFSMRFEIVKRLGDLEQLWSGWSATFPEAAVPSGARLSFWAVDTDEPRLYQLKNESSATTR
jgi:hypothetical protein